MAAIDRQRQIALAFLGFVSLSFSINKNEAMHIASRHDAR